MGQVIHDIIHDIRSKRIVYSRAIRGNQRKREKENEEE